MTIDLSQVKEITIPDGNVVKIEDASSNVLWKAETGFGYTIVKIDETVANPYDRVTYPASVTINSKLYKNCIPQSGFTEARGTSLNSWIGHKLIEGIQPVAMDSSGNWITSGYSLTDSTAWNSSYDWFTEFPFRWMAWYKTGSDVYVIFSDNNNNPDTTIFQDYAFLNNSNQRVPNFHFGCFDATVETVSIQGTSQDVLRSKRVSSKPKTNVTIGSFINYAKNRNLQSGLNDFDIITYYQCMYLIGLFVTLYKTTDCQGFSNDGSYGLGKGRVGMLDSSNITGGTLINGMSGTTANQSTMATFFWIHDIWGNVNNYIGGALPDSNRRLMTQTGRISSTDANDYNLTNLTPSLSSNVTNNTITTIAGGRDSGPFPQSTSSGVNNKYYADAGTVMNRYPYWGAYYGRNEYGGIFSIEFSTQSYNSSAFTGSRLSYKGGRT